jgi:hypothetical protein
LSKAPSRESWFDRLTTNGASNTDLRKDVIGIYAVVSFGIKFGNAEIVAQ